MRRKVRRRLTATISGLLLILSLGSALAGPSAAANPNVTPVTSEIREGYLDGYTEVVRGHVMFVEEVLHGTSVASDPRLNGTVTIPIRIALLPERPGVFDSQHASVAQVTGTIQIVNEQGWWEGSVASGWIEVTFPPDEPEGVTIDHGDFVAFGHGAYEGLQWRAEMTSWATTGSIFSPGA